ncbi:Aste57867_6279 [Aphanomyces stellatus]|uniref:Aste57867_6279 protein n=1 Tax=Aphanomyces stellatus TaxID=120398 RepID=A0A485KFN7_9STRA|nr:hypothetical protein As57867_006265 [Aphanomyces stellatus]VFT83277.1 Aste57867_6279 [Aphanomyces stellatus]
MDGLNTLGFFYRFSTNRPVRHSVLGRERRAATDVTWHVGDILMVNLRADGVSFERNWRPLGLWCPVPGGLGSLYPAVSVYGAGSLRIVSTCT